MADNGKKIMFTGIITHLGKVKNHKNSHLIISCKTLINKLVKGESIAVNGVCLTITKQNSRSLTVDIMGETYTKTALSQLNSGDLVNLELPATPTTFLSGHIVQGHVDGVGRIKQIKQDKSGKRLTVAIPQNIARYVVEKGSIAVNGISLTIIQAVPHQAGAAFTVGIIPYTWRHTMLKNVKVGDNVNIETDIIGKYVRIFIV